MLILILRSCVYTLIYVYTHYIFLKYEIVDIIWFLYYQSIIVYWNLYDGDEKT